MKNLNTDSTHQCYHCGDTCKTGNTRIEGKFFCCEGCKTVYEILQQNELCNYYNIQEHPGFSLRDRKHASHFEFLENPELASSLLSFKSETLHIVQFYVPKIHCSSCIWLLENMHRLNESIILSQVDFIKKEVTVHYQPQKISMHKVASLMSKIGYEPELNMQQAGVPKKTKYNRQLLYKIGVAGFCFGNVMLLSFPEYVSSGHGIAEKEFVTLFGILNISLALPVLFYSASDYFINSFKSLRQKYFTIDIPIALGLAAIALRSLFDIVSGTGPGYFDSLTGLVFFMMIGKYLQDATYNTLSFDRTYKSYFPFSVRVRRDKNIVLKKVAEIRIGDKLYIHSNEIIPCDAYLLSDQAFVDYSFVTGESESLEINCGELLYAGGRLKGQSVEVECSKPVSQSYLTQLWNNEVFTKPQPLMGYSLIANTISKYFSIVILIIASASLVYWYALDEARIATNSFTSVLIIACPCAIAITVPFVWGNIMRLLSNDGFYAKHSKVLEAISMCDTIVMDKTGTLTMNQPVVHSYHGKELSNQDLILVSSAARQSIHPLCRAIYNYYSDAAIARVDSFQEVTGKGIEASIGENIVLIGSTSFIFNTNKVEHTSCQTQVHISINGTYKGYFVIEQHVRESADTVLPRLNKRYKVYILSGDKSGTGKAFEQYISKEQILLNQTPQSKLNFIRNIQSKQHKVIMIGDGLNDAGSLKQADVGIAITDDLLHFTPGSDVIMNASLLSHLDKILSYSQFGRKLIYSIFAYSLIYNIIGMLFAIQGKLSPLIAAILMPMSSLSVIAFSYLGTWLKSRQVLRGKI